MEKIRIKVEVSWTDDNFCCVWNDEDAGTVLVTAKTLEKLKRDFIESLRLHIEGCVKDGDILPDYLVNGDYEPEYILDTAALLRDA
ncbi:MAG: CopG family transcriptional regulator, partial [Muribaculaceae bacterium]|nr:CopG family transcriptional regulator [Muribaculaceae bacterium]